MKVENNIMVDIETLGNVSNSIIASIGAVKFNLVTGETVDSFHRLIDLDSCISLGMVCSGFTIKWWLQQPQAARDYLCNGESVSIQDALNDFSEFCDGDYDIWGNSPRFDLGILHNAYKLIGKPIPWNFRNELDVRTIVAFNPNIKSNWKTVGVAHNAIDDCVNQVGYLSMTYNEILNNSK